jgi:hypothetical protein
LREPTAMRMIFCIAENGLVPINYIRLRESNRFRENFRKSQKTIKN